MFSGGKEWNTDWKWVNKIQENIKIAHKSNKKALKILIRF